MSGPITASASISALRRKKPSMPGMRLFALKYNKKKDRERLHKSFSKYAADQGFYLLNRVFSPIEVDLMIMHLS